MPISHLLDTSVYCQPLKPEPLPSVQQRWGALGDSAFATSVICEAEILYGLEWRKSERLQSSYERLLKNRISIFPVDLAVAKAFSLIKATCRTKGAPVPDFDLLIAATAKVHGLVLATLNIRHFQGIEGLACENWAS
jgi:predicted nucleic acid-binding protein